MKKLLFTLLIMVWSVLAAKADDVLPPYTGFPTIFHHVSMPMQEKFPKFWLLHVEDNDGRFVNFDYRLAGDTLIVDKDYVPVVCGYEWKDDLYGNDFLFIPAVRPNGSEYADTLYYRQEGDKVFCLLPEEEGEISAEYSVPEGIEAIGEYAFAGCRKLKRIHLPDSIRSIGDGAFSGSGRDQENEQTAFGVLFISGKAVAGSGSYPLCGGPAPVYRPRIRIRGSPVPFKRTAEPAAGAADRRPAEKEAAAGGS